MLASDEFLIWEGTPTSKASPGPTDAGHVFLDSAPITVTFQ